jgi:lambda family phage tail tape measure protein
MDQATATTMTSMADAIGQFAATGKLDMASLTQSIISDLVKIAAEKAITGIVGDLGLGGSSFTPSMDYGAAAASDALAQTSVTPMFAGGGTVQPGVSAVVGERGPELFTPNVGGTITNNSSLGMGANGASSITVQIQNQGTAQKAQSATPTQTAQGLIIQIVTADLQRNGPISQSMSNTYGLKRGG